MPVKDLEIWRDWHQSLSMKGQMANTGAFAGLTISVATTQMLLLQHESNQAVRMRVYVTVF